MTNDNQLIKNKWYKRHKLIAFEGGGIFFFGDSHGNRYTLIVKVEYFWGLFEKIIKIPYEVSMYGSLPQYEAYWQEVIDKGGYVDA